MTIILRREIDGLKKMIFSLSAYVEEDVQMAATAIVEQDVELAEKVLKRDVEVDDREIEVEEECLKILALHQPVANDLRYIITALKVNNDLERIGDLAVNMAEVAIRLADRGSLEIPYDLGALVGKVRAMLADSLDALMERDAGLAAAVGAADDEVDDVNRQNYAVVREAMQARPEEMERLIMILRVSHYLERIADHATNIAEDVIYMVNGDIVRHGRGE
ncbi:phosphate signaling complex protein PhoU [bacterium]|nr:phosphate signaling complex protein PhoU [bacterium]